MSSVNIILLEPMAGLEMSSENPHKPSQAEETIFDEFACDKTVRMPRLTPAPTPKDEVLPPSEKDSGSDPYNTD